MRWLPSRIIVGRRVGRSSVKYRPTSKLHWLRLAGRRHVRLDDEVASGRQLPRSVLQQPRHLTRRPSEEMAVRELCLAAAAAVESRAGFLLVEATRRSRRVDFHIGVVDGSGCAGTKFQPADEPRPRHGYRDHERAKDVGAVGRQHIGFRHRDDEVGRPEPPAVGARAAASADPTHSPRALPARPSAGSSRSPPSSIAGRGRSRRSQARASTAACGDRWSPWRSGSRASARRHRSRD